MEQFCVYSDIHTKIIEIMYIRVYTYIYIYMYMCISLYMYIYIYIHRCIGIPFKITLDSPLCFMFAAFVKDTSNGNIRVITHSHRHAYSCIVIYSFAALCIVIMIIYNASHSFLIIHNYA